MAPTSVSSMSPVAVVTGGASGIGRALAAALTGHGRRVFIADRQVERAGQVAAELTRAGGQVTAIALDVRDREQFASVVTDVIASAGAIDYLFNCAGIGVIGQAANYSAADWSEVVDVNLAGVYHGIAAAYPQMIRQRRGHIINIASLAGLVPAPLVASYTASKFGIVGLSRALRIEAAAHGVRVSVVCPAVIKTPILDGGRYGRSNDDVVALRRYRDRLDAIAADPDRLAQSVLNAIDRNRAIIIYPGWARALWYLERLSPSLTERWMRGLLQRLLR